MRDFNENNITDAVIERFENTPDARLKTVINSLVHHLHDFVRDVELTTDEWYAAIDFLTRTGQISINSRQEFILLSDTLGVSMLVDAVNHRMPKGATETTVQGPFYMENPPEFPQGFDISRGLKGETLFAEGTVSSADGQPLPYAILDVWQSDTDGYYDLQHTDFDEPTLRGRFRADARGYFYFWSILPSAYPIPHDGPVGQMLVATNRHPWRPAHLHFMISAAGHEKLITHVFVQGDRYLDSDAVFGVKNSLIREYLKERPGIAPDGKKIDGPWRRLKYDFRLKPSGKPEPKAAEVRSTTGESAQTDPQKVA
jgi:hydroxyquinol 1,2-dioxygenase